MAYGGSNDDVIDDVTRPSRVKVVIPISLSPVILKTARDRDSVLMGHHLPPQPYIKAAKKNSLGGYMHSLSAFQYLLSNHLEIQHILHGKATCISVSRMASQLRMSCLSRCASSASSALHRRWHVDSWSFTLINCLRNSSTSERSLTVCRRWHNIPTIHWLLALQLSVASLISSRLN